MNELLPEIANWASIRKYDSKPIPAETLRRILEAAVAAPSWANVQPWHFIAVRDKEMKAKLRKLAVGQPILETADTVVVCCGDLSAWSEEQRIKQIKELTQVVGELLDEERLKQSLKDPAYNPALRGREVLIARLYEQLSLAIAFMILQAKHEGIGSCIVGAFANDITGIDQNLYEEVKHDLELPSDKLILTLVTLGYPAEQPTKRPRKPFDATVSLEKYSHRFIS